MKERGDIVFLSWFENYEFMDRSDIKNEAKKMYFSYRFNKTIVFLQFYRINN